MEFVFEIAAPDGFAAAAVAEGVAGLDHEVYGRGGFSAVILIQLLINMSNCYKNWPYIPP